MDFANELCPFCCQVHGHGVVTLYSISKVFYVLHPGQRNIAEHDWRKSFSFFSLGTKDNTFGLGFCSIGVGTKFEVEVFCKVLANVDHALQTISASTE